MIFHHMENPPAHVSPWHLNLYYPWTFGRHCRDFHHSVSECQRSVDWSCLSGANPLWHCHSFGQNELSSLYPDFFPTHSDCPCSLQCSQSRFVTQNSPKPSCDGIGFDLAAIGAPRAFQQHLDLQLSMGFFNRKGWLIQSIYDKRGGWRRRNRLLLFIEICLHLC